MSQAASCWLPLVIALLTPGPAAAEGDPPQPGTTPFVVIAHPDTPVESVTREELERIFLGERREWSDGLPVVPLDLSMRSPTRSLFSTRVLRRSVGQVVRYWRRGARHADAPDIVPSEEEAVERVANTPGSIGYVSGSTPAVRVKRLALEE